MKLTSDLLNKEYENELEKAKARAIARAIIKFMPKEYYDLPVRQFIEETKTWLKNCEKDLK